MRSREDHHRRTPLIPRLVLFAKRSANIRKWLHLCKSAVGFHAGFAGGWCRWQGNTCVLGAGFSKARERWWKSIKSDINVMSDEDYWLWKIPILLLPLEKPAPKTLHHYRGCHWICTHFHFGARSLLGHYRIMRDFATPSQYKSASSWMDNWRLESLTDMKTAFQR